jgi:glycolate oxidase iron-sulfur subunit
MYLNLTDELKGDTQALAARDLIQDCVHCGMCLGACPTYGIVGDELDSPRGRIYQIKNLLEGNADLASVQYHLDRCLTCRACETACPSGVKYGHLVEWGRSFLAKKHRRGLGTQLKITGFRRVVTQSVLFDALWKVGSAVSTILPKATADKLKRPTFESLHTPIPVVKPLGLTVILHQGCVQKSMSPNVNHATVRLLQAWGVTVLQVTDGCCGAIAAHTDDAAGAKQMAVHNLSTWAPLLKNHSGALIVSNASGCGLQLKEYGHAFQTDETYARLAADISAAVRDVSEVLAHILLTYPDLKSALRLKVEGLPIEARRVAYHEPCTLQHGQKLKGRMAGLLSDVGVLLAPSVNTHLCCGSAGAYSVMQPELSQQLLHNKIQDLKLDKADRVLSGNIGCICHLASATEKPVSHWIEWLEMVWSTASN